MATEETFDVYDIEYLIADNAYRCAIDRKFKLERQIDQLQEELIQHEYSIARMERVLQILKSKTRVRY